MMNTIKRLELEQDLRNHQELLKTAVISNLFHTAKHECEVCIDIKRKLINNEKGDTI